MICSWICYETKVYDIRICIRNIMSIYNNINRRPSVKDMAERPKHWKTALNNQEELKYLSRLKNTKDILDYRDERETEVFLNNI
jgi:hypothetical protein